MNPTETKLADAWPTRDWHDVTVLLAVSGGCDSVALLRAMSALKTGGEGGLRVAHFNHRLRGDESAADETFVVDLCRQLSVPCELGSAGGEESPEVTSEEAARALRYRFLQQATGRCGARYVVTAHTADDQAETILQRIIRGTGIGGLKGMDRVRPLGPATLIRPLLEFRRAELRSYLGDLGQPYRRDSSNADVRFTRNRIRHELLPRLTAEFNPGVVEALLRLGTLAGEVQAVVDDAVVELLAACVRLESPAAATIELGPLAGRPSYLVRELLLSVWRRQDWPMQAMGFAQWDLLEAMFSSAAPRKQTLPGNVSAEVAEGRLRLVRAR